MGWFKVRSGRLLYRGRLSREPYSAWARTGEGSAAIEARARRDRLRVFARARAEGRLWRELDQVARREPLSTAIQSAADGFGAAVAAVSHAPGLPMRSIALHRLVLIPRVLVAGHARQALCRRLFDSEPLERLDPSVREFFCERLLVELDAAIAEHRPSIVRPIMTRDGWGCIGRDTEYQWVDPIFSGAGWSGHFVVYEFPRQRLPRRARKDLDAAVRDLQGGLPRISRIQREEMMRIAVDGLPAATG